MEANSNQETEKGSPAPYIWNTPETKMKHLEMIQAVITLLLIVWTLTLGRAKSADPNSSPTTTAAVVPFSAVTPTLTTAK